MLAPDNERRPQAEEPAGVKSATVDGVQVNGGAVANAVAAVVSEPITNIIAFKTGTAMPDTLLSRWNLLGRAARDSRLSRSDLAVLHAIADRIGDDGTAWPSVRRIADDASADKRTVTRSISRMCDCGYLLRKSGGFTTANVYRLGMGESVARGESAPMGDLAPTGESTGRGEAVAGYGRTRPEGMGEPAHVILPVNPPKEFKKKKPAFEKIGLEISDLIVDGIDEHIAKSWIAVRKSKKATLLTDIAWNKVKTEAAKAGIALNDAVRIAVEKNWTGFGADWNWGKNANAPPNKPSKQAMHTGFNDYDYEKDEAAWNSTN